MANYQIVLTVDGVRKESVEKKLRLAFGGEVPIFSVEKLNSPESRRARLDEASSNVTAAMDIVEELKSEMESWHDSIPENLQSGSKADEVQEAIDNLGELQDAMDNLDFGSVDFPGMF